MAKSSDLSVQSRSEAAYPRVLSKPLSTLLLALFGLVPMAPILDAQNLNSDIKLKTGEKLGTIYVTLRENYVVPQTISVAPGWYVIRIYNPNRVALSKAIALNDEAGRQLLPTQSRAQEAKNTLRYQFGPGKHALKLDEKNNLTLTIIVNPNNEGK